MTLALVAVDLDLTTDVRIDFTTQIAFDLVVGFKIVAQHDQLLIRKILDAGIRIDSGRGKRFLRTSAAYTKDVGERDLDALLIWDVDSGKTCNCDSFTSRRSYTESSGCPGPGLRPRGSACAVIQCLLIVPLEICFQP